MLNQYHQLLKMDKSTKVAVVSGSNKGIGFSIVKGLCERFDGLVYLTSRDEARGRAAVAELNKVGLYPQYHQLDIVDRKSVTTFRDYIKEKYGGLDILINNAAVFETSQFYQTYEEDKEIVEINYKGVLIIQELIFPLVRDNGRILNMSSSCGHLSNLRNKMWVRRFSSKNYTWSDINGFVQWFLECSKNGDLDKDDFADNSTFTAYRVSKVALSAATALQQKELEPGGSGRDSPAPGAGRARDAPGLLPVARRPRRRLVRLPSRLLFQIGGVEAIA